MRRILALLLLPLIATTALASGASASQTQGATLPTVSGKFGQTPKITFPNTKAPTKLETKVLQKGSGAVVKKSELLVANYIGQIWRGKVIDSSFARKEPDAFPIGIGEVIPGWDKVLVGLKLGTRVEMVLPPSDGYGPSGDSAAGITGADTLVFVVDLIAAYNKNVEGDAHATPVGAAPPGVTVKGKLGSAMTLSIAKNTKQPTAVSLKVLDRGNGPKVKAGIVVLQLVVVDWTTSQVVQSTWQLGTPEGDVVGDPSDPGVLDKLVGVPLGSRVLLELPKASEGGPYAIGIDVIAEPKGDSSQFQ